MKHYPTYLQSLGLLLIFLLCTILSLLVVLPFFSFESSVGMAIIYTLSISLTIAIALFLRRNFSFAFNSFLPGIVAVAVVTFLSIHLALDPLTNLIPLSDLLKKMIQETLQHPVAFFFMIVIAAPLLEELLFRGVILDGFLKNYHPWKAIFFSAFLFALVHGNLSQGVGAFVGGVLMGWIYWKTQSVIPGILIHLVNNLVAFISVLLTPEADIFKNTAEQIGNPVWYWLIVVGCSLIAIGGVWFLQNNYFKALETRIDTNTII